MRILSKECPGELEGEGGSLDGVCSPSLTLEATWGQVWGCAPGPAPRRVGRGGQSERGLSRGGAVEVGEQKGSLLGDPTPPCEARREADWGTPPLPAVGLRAAPTLWVLRWESPRRRPLGRKNQTGQAASQPIGEHVGQPRPMAAANANER